MLAKKHQILDFVETESIEVEHSVNKDRIYKLNSFEVNQNQIVYLMQREHRVQDNWGLLFAQKLALELNQSLKVILFLDSTIYVERSKIDFVSNNVPFIENELKKLNIGFEFINSSVATILKRLSELEIGAIVTDFFPLKFSQELNKKINENFKVAFYEVDSHNILPARVISQKQEFAAATLRPKVNVNIFKYLLNYPRLQVHPFPQVKGYSAEKQTYQAKANIDLALFIEQKLDLYDEFRNDPTKNVISNMSSYLHFGQISSQRIALEIIKSDAQRQNKEAYLEELVVRKELADNFCLYSPSYDSFEGIQPWAKETLASHSRDIRPYTYSQDEFEKAQTHDELWNAAQRELLSKNKIHSYMRMYWAKKILEWSDSPEEALKIAIYLNDKYSLDGIDPNGYVGILWSIAGLHDRPWGERPVFGKIRYMNYNGAAKKFDVGNYIRATKNVK